MEPRERLRNPQKRAFSVGQNFCSFLKDDPWLPPQSLSPRGPGNASRTGVPETNQEPEHSVGLTWSAAGQGVEAVGRHRSQPRTAAMAPTNTPKFIPLGLLRSPTLLFKIRGLSSHSRIRSQRPRFSVPPLPLPWESELSTQGL